MTKQETKNREQGADGLQTLLRRAMPPLGNEVELPRDLWPAMQVRLRRKEFLRAVPWFDWALAGGVTVFALVSPAAIPVLFYYL